MQKMGYKLLAYITEQRSTFLRANADDVMQLLVLGLATAHSAAKRHRLRCLKAAILLCADPSMNFAADDSDATPAERKMQARFALCQRPSLCRHAAAVDSKCA